MLLNISSVEFGENAAAGRSGWTQHHAVGFWGLINLACDVLTFSCSVFIGLSNRPISFIEGCDKLCCGSCLPTRYAWGLRHRKVYLGSRPHTCVQWKTNRSSSTLDCSIQCSAEYYMRDYMPIYYIPFSTACRKETNRGAHMAACCTFDVLCSGRDG